MEKRLNVHLYVTPICNLRCKHCYYDAKLANSMLERILTINEIAQIITDLSDKYSVAFDVEGGEFFLRQDITELFEAVPNRYWHNVTITTNGTVEVGVHPRHLQSLDEFRVSVEGHTDDLQRDLRGVSLAPVLKTCSTLDSSGVPITLRITLHKKNYWYLPEMIESFAGLGFTRFSMYEFQPVGRGYLCRHEYMLGSQEIEEVLELLCRKPITSDARILKVSLSARRISAVAKHRRQLTSRGYEIVDLSGIPSLTIDYNGDIGVCPWNVGSRSVGVFRRESFSSDMAEYMQAGLLYHECDYCSAIGVLYRG